MSGAYERFFPEADSTLWVSLRYFSLSRVLIALVLCLLQPLAVPNLEIVRPLTFQQTSFLYLAFALVFAVVARRAWPGFYPQLLVQISVDIVMLGLLMHFAGGHRSGVALLLFVPVAAAAVLSARRMALFFAAMASLTVLSDAVFQAASGLSEFSFLHAGLLGLAMFAIALVINSLASRLSHQEAVVKHAAAELRNQQQINQLVIAELTAGVVLLNADGFPRFMNPAAAQVLGLAPDSAVLEGPGWSAVVDVHREWLLSPMPRAEAAFIQLAQDVSAGALGTKRIRVRFLAALEAGDTVVVLEDIDHLEQRAQQMKLASMGRLSASIAHEIRNPLGAIRHANGLLAENLARDPAQFSYTQRFTDIVERNSLRINRIIEDVLSLARRDHSTPEPIQFERFMQEFLPEFFDARESKVSAEQRQRVRLQINTDRQFYFDAQQLRQVLINLLGNAFRYASDAPGAIVVTISANASVGVQGAQERLELRVSDDGPGLPPSVVAHLFEPFTTSEAQGTGLGLFLSQELCQLNQATIRYETGKTHGFVIRPRAYVVLSGAGLGASEQDKNASEDSVIQ
jgi:two-component system, NtrC family, sensor histidine kinase PilS